MRNEGKLIDQIEAKSNVRRKQIAMLQNLSGDGADVARMCNVLRRSEATVKKILRENGIAAVGYVPRNGAV